STQRGLGGDELHGGAGGDWLYGNLRDDRIFGDNGNEVIAGDWLAGPFYALHQNASVDGGNDELFGGSGEDKLLGGGGDDILWGGADSDWLEGQNGNDTMYGGAWIDIMVLDTSDRYDVFGDSIDGHFGNELPGDVADDNATDILLIEASDFDDTILLSEERVILSDLPITGNNLNLSGSFTLSLNGLEADLTVTVSGGSLETLAFALNTAIESSVLASQVEAVVRGENLALLTRGYGRQAQLVFTGDKGDDFSQYLFSEDVRQNVDADPSLYTVGGAEYLVVDMTNGFGTVTAIGTWRDGAHPLVEQFRVSGLGGDDIISFAAGQNAPDVQVLNDRSNDFVGVLDGGPGDDILSGTG
ncbi:MAG: calcium-binding protein, partial [Verrucomicrobiia bacterium]